MIKRVNRIHNITLFYIPRELSRFTFYLKHEGGSNTGTAASITPEKERGYNKIEVQSDGEDCVETEETLICNKDIAGIDQKIIKKCLGKR